MHQVSPRQFLTHQRSVLQTQAVFTRLHERQPKALGLRQAHIARRQQTRP